MPGTCKCGVKKTSRIVGGTETEVFTCSDDERQILSCDLMVVQVNEYPWIAAFDLSGVDGANPGGCAATLVRSHSSQSTLVSLNKSTIVAR